MNFKKRVLVTGGAGYIGSHTSFLLKKTGYKVSIRDNLERGRKEVCRGFPLYQVDLRNKKDLEKVFRKNSFEAIIHFAGFIQVGESMKNPDLYFENNVGGTINLLNMMGKFGVKLLVFSSSAAVYGFSKKIPISEDATLKPQSAYGQTKLMVEQMLPWYEQAFGIRYVALRYFNAAGAALDGKNGEAHKPETHLIPLLIRAALKKDYQFRLFGNDYPTRDGTCIRDYVHVVDLADAHLKALSYLIKEGKSQFLNVGTGRGYSNLEVIKMVKKTTGVDFPVKIEKRRAGDPSYLVARSQKILKILKWKPRYSDLEMIVKTAFCWHKNHPFTLED